MESTISEKLEDLTNLKSIEDFENVAKLKILKQQNDIAQLRLKNFQQHQIQKNIYFKVLPHKQLSNRHLYVSINVDTLQQFKQEHEYVTFNDGLICISIVKQEEAQLNDVKEVKY